ncbi:50S ribosomal protein L29 [Acidithiobacillus acidisediminis]|jgi:large subunit ribosomal protein L29|uniref:50S ribosomal protein L29 n=1 Tax=Acidithiobacillus acidisediminis TaxID=2937799 RepID=UPI00200C384F|nr:50S ribosomal protein L29 [Acidithiobacillus sp. S30A2]
MKGQDLSTLSASDCQARLLELLEEQFKLRMQHGTGQLAKTARLRGVRRDIARVRTEITKKAKVSQ